MIAMVIIPLVSLLSKPDMLKVFISIIANLSAFARSHMTEFVHFLAHWLNNGEVQKRKEIKWKNKTGMKKVKKVLCMKQRKFTFRIQGFSF